jgi:hypothetical protein
MHAADAFDPYAAQARARWRNRVDGWRATPGETAFHAGALLLALGIAGWLLLASWPSLRAALHALLANPALASLLWLVAVGIDQHRLRRVQRQRWANDWFVAQPITPAQRQRRRWNEAFSRMLALGLPVVVVLLLAERAVALLPAGLLALLGAAVGHWLADHPPRLGAARQRRYSMLQASGPGSLWRWQWIVAGRALTPRALAACLPVLLLIPRGPALLLGVAIVMVMVLATTAAWLRMLAVIVDAQRWLDVQPLPGRDWLPAALWLPLALLGTALLTAAAAMALGGASSTLLLALPLLGALALLHLGAVLAERRRPRRIVLLSAAQQLLLLAGLQVAPPLLPLLFLLQLGWLLRRGWQA